MTGAYLGSPSCGCLRRDYWILRGCSLGFESFDQKESHAAPEHVTRCTHDWLIAIIMDVCLSANDLCKHLGHADAINTSPKIFLIFFKRRYVVKIENSSK